MRLCMTLAVARSAAVFPSYVPKVSNEAVTNGAARVHWSERSRNISICSFYRGLPMGTRKLVGLGLQATILEHDVAQSRVGVGTQNVAHSDVVVVVHGS